MPRKKSLNFRLSMENPLAQRIVAEARKKGITTRKAIIKALERAF